MNTPDDAIKAIRNMDVSSFFYGRAYTQARSVKTKEAQRRRDAAKLFLMLTGEKPTDAQLTAMLDW
jgi:hypothetical protein